MQASIMLTLALEMNDMDAFFRSPWVALIGFAGVAILAAALFAARHGQALMACAL